jgi:2-dehydropantoate 2-reductase
LDQADIKYNYTVNPYTEIWSKFIFIASFGLVTANYDKTIGEVLESEDLRSIAASIMTEIYNLAVKQGIDLPPRIIEDSFSKANKFPFETKTSFQRDFEVFEKDDERDLFGGTVIRMGKKFGVDTSVTRKVYDSLQIKKPISRWMSGV